MDLDPSLFDPQPSVTVPSGPEEDQQAVDATPSPQSVAPPMMRRPVWEQFVTNTHAVQANRQAVQAERDYMRDAATQERQSRRVGDVFKGAAGKLLHRGPSGTQWLDPADYVDDPMAGPEARKSLWDQEVRTARKAESDTGFMLRDPSFHAQGLGKTDREAVDNELAGTPATDPRYAELSAKRDRDDAHQAEKARLAQESWDHGARARALESMHPDQWWRQEGGRRVAPSQDEQRQAVVGDAQQTRKAADMADAAASDRETEIRNRMRQGVRGDEMLKLQDELRSISANRGSIAEIRSGEQRALEQQRLAAAEAAKPKAKDFFRMGDAVSAIWDAVKGLGSTAPAAFYQLTEGLERPDKYSESAKAAFAEADAYNKEMQAKTDANLKAGTSSSVGESIREAGQSLAFSGASMAAQLPARLAAAGVSAKMGAVGGSVIGPEGTVGGAVVGGVSGFLASEAAGMAAGGAAAYRMAGAMFLNEAFQNIEAKKGRPLTEEEKAKYYEQLLPIARNTALWEAGPEAVGNAITLRGLGSILGFGKAAASGAAKKTLAQTIGKKAMEAAGVVSGELTTETITQVEQGADQLKAEAIAAGKDPSAIRADWSLGGVNEAFQQVYPQTLALLGLTGGAGGIIKVGSKLTGIGQQPEPDQIQNEVTTALAAIDPEAPPPRPGEIKRALDIADSREGNKGVARSVLIERELGRVSMEDNAALSSAQEALTAATASNDKPAIKLAEEAVGKVRGRAEHVRAVLKLASGQSFEILTGGELAAMGFTRDDKGVVNAMTDSELEKAGLDDTGFTIDDQGNVVISDTSIKRAAEISPRAAERIGTLTETEQLRLIAERRAAAALAAAQKLSIGTPDGTRGDPATGAVTPSETKGAVEFDVPMRIGPPVRVRAASASDAEGMAAGMFRPHENSVQPGQATPVIPTQQANVANPQGQPAGQPGVAPSQVPVQPLPTGTAAQPNAGAAPGGTAGAGPAEAQAKAPVAGTRALERANGRLKKVRKALGADIVVTSDPALAGGATEGGEIAINPEAIIAEAVAAGMNDAQALARFNAILDEEIKHLAQQNGAIMKWITLGGLKAVGPFAEWYQAYYGGRWQTEFVKTGKDKVARTIYAKGTATESLWDQTSDADKFMEATRMMMQRREGAMVTEQSRLWDRISTELKQDLLDMLRALREMVKRIGSTPTLEADIKLFENELRKIVRTKPRAGDTKAGGPKPAAGPKGAGTGGAAKTERHSVPTGDGRPKPPPGDGAGSPLKAGQRVEFDGPNGPVEGTLRNLALPGAEPVAVKMRPDGVAMVSVRVGPESVVAVPAAKVRVIEPAAKAAEPEVEAEPEKKPKTAIQWMFALRSGEYESSNEWAKAVPPEMAREIVDLATIERDEIDKRIKPNDGKKMSKEQIELLNERRAYTSVITALVFEHNLAPATPTQKPASAPSADYEQAAKDYHNKGYVTGGMSNDPKFWEAVRIESDKRTAKKPAADAEAKPSAPKKHGKAVIHSSYQAHMAIEELRRIREKDADTGRFSGTRKHQADKAWSSLKLHAEKLGIEVPRRGTYYDSASDVVAANEIAKKLIPWEEVYREKNNIPPTTPAPKPAAAPAEVEGETKAETVTAESIEAEYQQRLRMADQWKDTDPEQTARLRKAAGMQRAAAMRKLTGNLTPKEAKAKQDREDSNYKGKPVSVDGRNGKIGAVAFGKVIVVFDDGTKQTVAQDNIQPPLADTPPQPTTPTTPWPKAKEKAKAEKAPKAAETPTAGERSPAEDPLADLKKRLVDGMSGLFSGTLAPDYARPIPPDKFAVLMPVAADFIKAGVDTPAKLAGVLGDMLDGRLVPFSQSLWFMFKAAGAQGAAEPEWGDVYGATVKESLTVQPEAKPPAINERIFTADYTGPRWTYGMRNRPLSIGTAPKGFIIGSDGPSVGRARHGTIQYPRELTEKEIYDFELEVMPEPVAPKPAATEPAGYIPPWEKTQWEWIKGGDVRKERRESAVRDVEDAVNRLGRDRIAEVHGLKPDETVREWLDRERVQQPVWDKGGRKTGQTAIQKWGKKETMPIFKDTVGEEQLRKAVLEYIRGYNNDWMLKGEQLSDGKFSTAVAHRKHVERALAEKRDVPAKVLADYPDLMPKSPAAKTPPPVEEVKNPPGGDGGARGGTPAAKVKRARKVIDTPARREAYRILRSDDLKAITAVVGQKIQAPPVGMLKIIKGISKSRNITEKQATLLNSWDGFDSYASKNAFGNDFNGKVAQELHGMLFTNDATNTAIDDWASLLGDVTNDEAMIKVMGELNQVAKGLSNENDPRNQNREWTDDEIAAEESKLATPAQNKAFAQGNDFDFGREEIEVSDLNEGDTVTIDGQEMTVEAVEEGGTVVLRDGTRFGRQVLASGESVWVESGESVDADPEQLEIEAGWLVDKSEKLGYSSIDEHADADPEGFEAIASEAEAVGQGDSPVGVAGGGPKDSGVAKGGFSLEAQTEEQIKAEEDAARIKAEIQKRKDARLTGTAGDTTADMFGEGRTPLFNERRDNPKPKKPADAPIIESLKKEIASQKELFGELTQARVVDAIKEASWRLMGDKNTDLRQDAMEFLTGTRPVKAKAGVINLADALKKWIDANPFAEVEWARVKAEREAKMKAAETPASPTESATDVAKRRYEAALVEYRKGGLADINSAVDTARLGLYLGLDPDKVFADLIDNTVKRGVAMQAVEQLHRTWVAPEIAGKSENFDSAISVGDKVTFTPNDKRSGIVVTGIIQDKVTSTGGAEGYNIFNPTPSDPYRVTRVWMEDGSIEKAQDAAIKGAGGEAKETATAEAKPKIPALTDIQNAMITRAEKGAASERQRLGDFTLGFSVHRLPGDSLAYVVKNPVNGVQNPIIVTISADGGTSRTTIEEGKALLQKIKDYEETDRAGRDAEMSAMADKAKAEEYKKLYQVSASGAIYTRNENGEWIERGTNRVLGRKKTDRFVLAELNGPNLATREVIAEVSEGRVSFVRKIYAETPPAVAQKAPTVPESIVTLPKAPKGQVPNPERSSTGKSPETSPEMPGIDEPYSGYTSFDQAIDDVDLSEEDLRGNWQIHGTDGVGSVLSILTDGPDTKGGRTFYAASIRGLKAVSGFNTKTDSQFLIVGKKGRRLSSKEDILGVVVNPKMIDPRYEQRVQETREKVEPLGFRVFTPVEFAAHVKKNENSPSETSPAAQVVRAAKQTLTAAELKAAAKELGFASWNAQSAEAFAERLADWMSGVVDGISDALAAFFQRVWNVLKTSGFAGMAFLSLHSSAVHNPMEVSIALPKVNEVEFNTSTMTQDASNDDLGTIGQPRTANALTSADDTSTGALDTTVTARSVDMGAAPTVDTSLQVPVDASSMSPAAKASYLQLYPALKDELIRNDKLMIITDKPTATTFVFNPDGSLLLKTKVLLGWKVGDFYKGDTEASSNNRITPAGLFNLGLRDAKRGGGEAKTAGAYDFGKVFVLDKAIEGSYSVTLFHSVWLHEADAAQRAAALKKEGADDSRYSFGCINLPRNVFKQLLDSHQSQMDGAKLFIVPDNTAELEDFLSGDTAQNKSGKDGLTRLSIPTDGMALDAAIAANIAPTTRLTASSPAWLAMTKEQRKAYLRDRDALRSGTLAPVPESMPQTGKPFEFYSVRNTDRSPNMGARFGQDIEPAGRYMTQSSPESAKGLDPKFEHGPARFKSPLVLLFGAGYGDPANWKNVLSARYGGKKGAELSRAIIADGHDGIVTTEPETGPSRPAHTSEIVDLRPLDTTRLTASSPAWLAMTKEQRKAYLRDRDALRSGTLAGSSARHAELEAKFNAGTITPEETAEAERIVAERAESVGFEPGTFIHETTSKEAFDVFKVGGPKLQPGQELTSGDIWGEKLSGHAIWFRPEGGRSLSAHQKGEKREIRVKLKLRMPLMEDPTGIEEYGGFTKDFPQVVQPSDVTRLKQLGRDSVVYLGKNREILEILVFDPSRIKSAAPFTGERLDNRFDPKSDSILRSGSLAPSDARYLELAKDPEKNRDELQRMVDQAAKRAGTLAGSSARHAELEAKHNAGTITPEETEEAERIVAERAKAAGYGIGPMWHAGKNQEFDVFNQNSHFGSIDAAKKRIKDKGLSRNSYQDGNWLEETDPSVQFRKFFLQGNYMKVRDYGSWSVAAMYPGTFKYLDDLLLHDKKITKAQYEKWIDKHNEAISKTPENATYEEWAPDVESAFGEFMTEIGYDGLVYNNTYEYGGDSYLVFNPAKIKSAAAFTGERLDNRFDPKSDSILRSGSLAPTPTYPTFRLRPKGVTINVHSNTGIYFPDGHEIKIPANPPNQVPAWGGEIWDRIRQTSRRGVILDSRKKSGDDPAFTEWLVEKLIAAHGVDEIGNVASFWSWLVTTLNGLDSEGQGKAARLVDPVEVLDALSGLGIVGEIYSEHSNTAGQLNYAQIGGGVVLYSDNHGGYGFGRLPTAHEKEQAQAAHDKNPGKWPLFSATLAPTPAEKRGRAAFEKNRPLFDTAREHAETFGRETIGANPKFANPGMSPQAREPFDITRMIDSHQREIRKDRDTFSRGRELLDRHPEEVERLLLESAYGDDPEFIGDYRQHAVNLLLDRKAQEAGGDIKKMEALYVLASANIINGREMARAFRMRMDRFAKPAERAQQQIADAIFTPSKKIAARAEVMAPAKRKEFLAAEAEKRIKDVEAALHKQYGLRIENIMGKNRDLQLKNSELERKVTKLMNTMERDILEAVQRGASPKDIRKRFGPIGAEQAERVVEKAMQEFFKSITEMAASGMDRQAILNAVKPGLRSGGLGGGSPASSMTEEEVWQMIRQDLGLSKDWVKRKTLPNLRPKAAALTDSQMDREESDSADRIAQSIIDRITENRENPKTRKELDPIRDLVRRNTRKRVLGFRRMLSDLGVSDDLVETLDAEIAIEREANAEMRKTRQPKPKVISNPLSADWSRPRLLEGLKEYVFDTTDRAGIMERVEIIRNLAGALGKIDKLQGDRLAKAKTALAGIDAILKKYGTTAAGIFEAGRKIEDYRFDPNDIAQVAAVARTINALDADLIDQATEYLYASMLSGLQTMLVNATAILPATWESTVGRGVNMAINTLVKNPMSEQYGEGRFILSALGPALARAKSNFTASLAAQHPMFDRDVNAMEIDWDKILGGGSHRMIGSITGRKGDIIRLPMRLLTATDDFNRTLIACCEVGTFAYRMARMKGMKDGSPEMDQFIRKEVNTPGSVSYHLASQKASSAIYSNPLPGQHDPHTGKAVPVNDAGDVVGYMAGRLTDAVSKDHDNIFVKTVSAAMRISFFPFQRTPFNIIRKGIRHTFNPVSLFDIALGVYRNAKDADGKWNWKIEGDDKAAFDRRLHRMELVERMGQQLQGAILMTVIVGAAAAEGDDDDQDKRFIMTGSSPFLPTGRSERDARMRSGLGPFRLSWRNADGSERIGFSYGRIEPVATLLAATIDSVKAYKRKLRGGGDAYDVSANILGGLVAQAQDKTFMKGVGDLIGMSSSVMAEPDIRENRKALQFIAGRVAMVVPNIIKQPIREADSQFRERSSGFMEELMYQAVPYGQKAAKVDPYGNPTTKPGSAVARIIDVSDGGLDLAASKVGLMREPVTPVNKTDAMLLRWSDKHPDKAWFPQPIINAEYEHKATKQKIKMTADQLDEFRRKAGVLLEMNLRSAGINYAAPTEFDVERVKKAVTKARSVAKDQLAFKFSRETPN